MLLRILLLLCSILVNNPTLYSSGTAHTFADDICLFWSQQLGGEVSSPAGEYPDVTNRNGCSSRWTLLRLVAFSTSTYLTLSDLTVGVSSHLHPIFIPTPKSITTMLFITYFRPYASSACC